MVVVVVEEEVVVVAVRAIIMLAETHGQCQLRKQTKEKPALEGARVLKRRGEHMFADGGGDFGSDSPH